MSLKNKNVLSSNVGNPINAKDITNFYDLDNLLSLIVVPSYYELPNDVRPPIIDNFQAVLEELSIPNANNKIIELFNLINVKDALMIATGRYFVVDQEKQIIIKNSNDYAFRFYRVSYTDRARISNRSNTYLTKVDVTIDDRSFGSFINSCLPKTNQILNTSIFNWLKLVFIYSLQQFLNLNRETDYCHYDYYLREQKNEYNNSYYFDINSQYNYYVSNYEDTFNQDFSYLNLIPNYHAVNSYLINDNTSTHAHLTLGNKVEISKQNISSKEYFDNFSTVVDENVSDTLFLNTYSSILNGVLVDTTTNKANQISTENFPYVNSVSFYNDSNIISKYLLDNELDFLALNNCYFGYYEGLSTTNSIFTVQNTNTQKIYDTNGSLVDVNGQRYNNEYQNLVDTQYPPTLEYSTLFSFNTFSPYGFDIKSTRAFTFENNLNSLKGVDNIFKSIKLDNYMFELFDKYNNYDTVYSLNLLTADAVCYFIEKFSDTNLRNQVVGTTVENTTDISYQDTQVVYNKNITYNVYEANMVPLVNLVYEKNIVLDYKLTIDLNTTIKPKVYKNLIFTHTTSLTDSPPLAPSIRFVNYFNVPNVVNLLFTTLVGSNREYPIFVEPDDNRLFMALQEKEKIKDGKIKFETDNLLSKVQIYRTTTKPSSYADFNGSLLQEVSFNNLASTAFLMDVTPNTKYYLIFRGVDVHGLVSNPTDVFELEAVNNDGAVYCVINTTNFENKVNYDLNKSFKKYLSISPAYFYKHVYLLDDNGYKFGNDEKLWNKKFKIRVTSKKSGKSFDINLRCVKKELDLT